MLNVFLIITTLSGCATLEAFGMGRGRGCPAPPVIAPKPKIIKCIGLATGTLWCCDQTGCKERAVVNNICVTPDEKQALDEYIDTLERNVHQ